MTNSHTVHLIDGPPAAGGTWRLEGEISPREIHVPHETIEAIICYYGEIPDPTPPGRHRYIPAGKDPDDVDDPAVYYYRYIEETTNATSETPIRTPDWRRGDVDPQPPDRVRSLLPD